MSTHSRSTRAHDLDQYAEVAIGITVASVNRIS